jgi:hypothetical protein
MLLFLNIMLFHLYKYILYIFYFCIIILLLLSMYIIFKGKKEQIQNRIKMRKRLNFYITTQKYYF